MVSIRDRQLINSLWVILGYVADQKFLQVLLPTRFKRSFSFSGTLLAISYEAALVLAAELGLYECLAFLFAMLAFIVQSDSISGLSEDTFSEIWTQREFDAAPQLPGGDEVRETGSNAQRTEEQPTNASTVPTGEHQSLPRTSEDVSRDNITVEGTRSLAPQERRTSKTLRSSFLSLSASFIVSLSMVAALERRGLSILNPPEELTTEILDKDVPLLRSGAVVGKRALIGCLSVPRFKFRKIWPQIAVSIAHAGLLSAIWYGWHPKATSDSSSYVAFLAMEVWTGRHLLYGLSMVAALLQHSLTRREHGLIILGRRFRRWRAARRTREIARENPECNVSSSEEVNVVTTPGV